MASIAILAVAVLSAKGNPAGETLPLLTLGIGFIITAITKGNILTFGITVLVYAVAVFGSSLRFEK